MFDSLQYIVGVFCFPHRIFLKIKDRTRIIWGIIFLFMFAILSVFVQFNKYYDAVLLNLYNNGLSETLAIMSLAYKILFNTFHFLLRSFITATIIWILIKLFDMQGTFKALFGMALYCCFLDTIYYIVLSIAFLGYKFFPFDYSVDHLLYYTNHIVLSPMLVGLAATFSILNMVRYTWYFMGVMQLAGINKKNCFKIIAIYIAINGIYNIIIQELSYITSM